MLITQSLKNLIITNAQFELYGANLFDILLRINQAMYIAKLKNYMTQSYCTTFCDESFYDFEKSSTYLSEFI